MPTETCNLKPSVEWDMAQHDMTVQLEDVARRHLVSEFTKAERYLPGEVKGTVESKTLKRAEGREGARERENEGEGGR